jgi:hypothetical protein
VSASPSTAGQLFYNSTSGTLKGISLGVAAWSSGGNLSTARASAGNAGTTTAALAFGGNLQPGTTSSTEEYNGSSWTAGGSMGTARYGANGFGTQTSAVGAGGSPYPGTAIVEEYNGSSWTAVTSLPSVRQNAMAFGIESNGVVAGGNVGSTKLSSTLEYDGTNWTSGGTLGTARYQGRGTGASQTAGLAIGGSTAPGPSGDAGGPLTEEYDGSTWTTGGNLNTGRRTAATSGIQTSALAAGGRNAAGTAYNNTELYDGTTWTVAPTMATARSAVVGSLSMPSNSSSLCYGGQTGSYPSITNATEEFTSAQYVAKTLTTS